MHWLKVSIFSLLVLFIVILLLGRSSVFGRSSVLQPSPLKNSIESNTAVFLLNLDRSPERLEAIMPLLNSLSIKTHRISAVDGNKITDDEIGELVDLKKFAQYRGRLPKKGEIGCALSHYKALKQFLETDLSFALIIEDDAVFDHKVINDLIHKAIEKRGHWDVLAMQLNHRGLPVSVAPLVDGYKIVKYYGSIVEAGAYLVNRKAAEAYVAYFFPIILPYDYFYTREWEMGIKFRGVEPRPVGQAEGHSYIDSSYNTAQTNDNFNDKGNSVSKLGKYIFNTRTAISRIIAKPL